MGNNEHMLLGAGQVTRMRMIHSRALFKKNSFVITFYSESDSFVNFELSMKNQFKKTVKSIRRNGDSINRDYYLAVLSHLK